MEKFACLKTKELLQYRIPYEENKEDIEERTYLIDPITGKNIEKEKIVINKTALPLWMTIKYRK